MENIVLVASAICLTLFHENRRLILCIITYCICFLLGHNDNPLLFRFNDSIYPSASVHNKKRESKNDRRKRIVSLFASMKCAKINEKKGT